MEVNNKVSDTICYRLITPVTCNEDKYRDYLLNYARKILSIEKLTYDLMVTDSCEYKTIWYPKAQLIHNGQEYTVPMCRVIKNTYIPGIIYGRYKRHEILLEIIISPEFD